MVETTTFIENPIEYVYKEIIIVKVYVYVMCCRLNQQGNNMGAAILGNLRRGHVTE